MWASQAISASEVSRATYVIRAAEGMWTIWAFQFVWIYRPSELCQTPKLKRALSWLSNLNHPSDVSHQSNLRHLRLIELSKASRPSQANLNHPSNLSHMGHEISRKSQGIQNICALEDLLAVSAIHQFDLGHLDHLSSESYFLNKIMLSCLKMRDLILTNYLLY